MTNPPWMHDTPRNNCPDCGKVIEAASNAESDATNAPAAGDYVICFACTAILVFDAHVRLRWPTPAERADVPDELLDVVAQLSLFNAGRTK
ncbi:MAG TPA: hypothetical protein VGO53_16510 [Steroidobacteraceae bacterium]|jgi:hypothetical protein|nr:hypothetical protein [Steroidobacteraceae bacterium]